MEQYTVSNISELIQMTGFSPLKRSKQDIGVGEIFGFPVQITGTGKKAPYYFVFTLSYSLNKDQIKRGVQAFKKIAGFTATAPNTFTLTFTPKKGKAWDTYQQMLGALQGYLTQEGLYATDTCAQCGLQGPELLGFVDNKLNKIHSHCLQEKIVQQEQKIKEDDKNASYIKGLIGGFLGGMVAIIPSFITIYFMNYMFVYLYLLIPMGVYYGYTKFGGKLDGIVPPIFTAVFAVIQVYTIEVLFFYFKLKEVYTGVTLTDAIDYRFNYDLGLLTEDTIFALICVVVGIVVAMNTFKGSSKKILQENQELVSLTVPRMQLAGQPVQQAAATAYQEPVAEVGSYRAPVAQENTYQQPLAPTAEPSEPPVE